jgi:folate-binding protein YgfZ
MTDAWPNILSQRGALIDATGNPSFEPPSAPATASLVPLLQEASILVHGEDAESFLQSQLSNDIGQVSATQGQLAAYCTPKGRVLATFSVWPDDSGGYVLRLPSELAEPMRKRLQIYVLRARVRLEDISDRVALLGLAGPQSVSRFRSEFGAAPAAPFDVVRIEDCTAMALPGERIELAVSRGSATSIWDRLVAAGCTPAGQAEWDAPAISSGAATVLAATSDQFIPQMLNLELIGGIAFDKGCYPGQEIVARSQYRGQVKRRLRRFASVQPAQPGAPLCADDGSPAGTVVNIAMVPGGSYELLAVTSSEASHIRLHLADLRDSTLQPLPLPYDLPASPADGD